MGLLPGGARNNQKLCAKRLELSSEVDSSLSSLCFDPQTSGGLLCAVPPDKQECFEHELSAHSASAVKIGIFNSSRRIKLK